MTTGHDITSTSAMSAVLASYKVQFFAIVILTTSGKSALELSKYRPICPIITIIRRTRVKLSSGAKKVIIFIIINIIFIIF